nr:MAG TPA: tail assembly chaperone protein [Caudoviricetes sp.]
MLDEKNKVEETNTEEKTEKIEKVVGEVEENPLIVKFGRTVHFEDESYDSVDLSGLEMLTGRDMVMTSKTLARSGDVSMLPEMSMEYAFLMAAKAAKLPVEFFYNLPPKECIKIKNRVTNFLYGEE